MTDVIVILVLGAMVGLAVGYIVKAKKSGKKCIGCAAGTCEGRKNGGCACCTGCSPEKE